MVGTNKWTDEQVVLCFDMQKKGFRKWEIADRINQEWPRRAATSAGVNYVLNNKKKQVVNLKPLQMHTAARVAKSKGLHINTAIPVANSKPLQIKNAARVAAKLNHIQYPQIDYPIPDGPDTPSLPDLTISNHLSQKELLETGTMILYQDLMGELLFTEKGMNNEEELAKEPEQPTPVTQVEPEIETELAEEPENEDQAQFAQFEPYENEQQAQFAQFDPYEEQAQFAPFDPYEDMLAQLSQPQPEIDFENLEIPEIPFYGALQMPGHGTQSPGWQDPEYDIHGIFIGDPMSFEDRVTEHQMRLERAGYVLQS